MIYSIKKITEYDVKSLTKIGGYPIWLNEVQIPINDAWNEPMMFFGQVALHEYIDLPKKVVAYIFFTNPKEPGEDFIDPDIIFPNEGANAVIVQWEGESNDQYINHLTISNKESDVIISFNENKENSEFGIITQLEPDKDNLQDKLFGVPDLLCEDDIYDDYPKLLLQLGLWNIPLYVRDDLMLFVFMSDAYRDARMIME